MLGTDFMFIEDKIPLLDFGHPQVVKDTYILNIEAVSKHIYF